MKKRILIMSAIFLATAIFVAGWGLSPASAQDRRPPEQLPPPKMTAPAWIKGTVTAPPQAGKSRTIEVDSKSYTLMQDIRIAQLIQSQPGIVNEIQIDFRQIRKGNLVNMKVLGNRVHEIQIPLR